MEDAKTSAQGGPYPPLDLLASFSDKRYPGIWKYMEQMLECRYVDRSVEWNDAVFLPVGGWYAVTTAITGTDPLDFDSLGVLERLAAVGPWRYTKDVVRLDPDLCHELINTEITDDIPDEVLFRLPSWSVYVELPEPIQVADQKADGFFVYLEDDMNDRHLEIRFLFHLAEEGVLSRQAGLGPWIPWYVHLGCGGIKAGVIASNKVSRDALARHHDDNTPNTESLISRMIDYADAFETHSSGCLAAMNVVLYLCMNGWSKGRPLITTEGGGRKPVAVKRLYPADKVTFRDLGKEFGDAYRAAMADAERHRGDGTHASPRPHVRRAHWQGYHYGKGRTQYKMNWIHPILVGSSKED